MNKIAAITIISIAIVATTAHAQDVVVIKDSRQYAPFNSSVSGPVGCTMPKDFDHPNLGDRNECRVTRSRLTTSGELLTRNNARGLCTRSVFSGGTRRIGGAPYGEVIPDQSISEETFKCDTSGIRVSASFEATTADKDLQAILTRWVKAEGKKLVWEVDGNAGVDAVALNEAASLNKATTFAMALDQLNQVIGRVHATDHKKPEPLKACQFDDAIVIRTISQPDCGTLH